MNTIVLKPGREASVYRFHHWIFSGAIQDKGSCNEGDLVRIKSAQGETLGYGHFHDSSISVRILQFGGSELRPDFWQNKFQEALALRKRLYLLDNADTNAFRLIHGEGDGLPGLIIDIYNNHAVIQCHTHGMYRQLDEIAAALQNVYPFPLFTIYDKSKESLGNLPAVDNRFVYGETPETIIHENKNQFHVNWVTGQKTGFFIDQRDNRKLFGQYCRGKELLNLFCYSGGFSIYGINHGAAKVDSVDVSTKAIELTDLNMQLTQNASHHKAYASDVNSFIATAPLYDIIVCDPPAFAKSLNKRHQALNGYKNLNAKVIKKIKRGGLLFTFSCSQVMDRELFQQTILSAALETKRRVKIIHHLSQSPDHPINLYHPEGSYLKGLVLYIED